nr:extracellular solute-binding protein [Arenivirga flava]
MPGFTKECSDGTTDPARRAPARPPHPAARRRRRARSPRPRELREPRRRERRDPAQVLAPALRRRRPHHGRPRRPRQRGQPHVRRHPDRAHLGSAVLHEARHGLGGGRAPDLAIIHAARLPGYAPGGLLDPWDLDLLAEFGVRREDFGDRVWESGTFDGDVYSIALDSHPFILFYNTDHAAAAGLMEGDRMRQPTSPDDFLDMVTAMKEASGGSGLSYGYVNDGAQMWRLWYTLYLQQGGVMELPIGGEARIDDEPAVEAFRFIQQLVDPSRGVPNADIQTALAEFISGDSGMLLSGVWELPSLQAAGLPIDAMPIPNLYGTPAAYADSHAFVLPHQNDVDEDARREVYRFVAEILKDSFDWAGAGHVPAYLPVTEDPAYADLLPQANYAAVAEIINYDPPAWFTGSGSDFQSLFAENLQPVLLAGADPQAGIDRFRAALDELLGKPNPV